MTKDLKLCVSALIPRDGRYLFVKNKKDGLYGLPMGKVEYEETPVQAIRREGWEETGSRLKVLGLIRIYQFNSSHQNWITNFVYLGKNLSEPTIIRPKEIDKIEWLSLGQLLKLRKKKLLRADYAQLAPIYDFIRRGTTSLATNDLVRRLS